MIENLCLNNFRNLKHKDLNLNNKLVIFKGQNASGKTSILEAIYLISTSKSHRTNNYKEMINNEASSASITLKANKTLKVILAKDKKSYFINDRDRKNMEFLGNIKAVMFSSLDLKTIVGANAERRKFLDINLSLIDERYLKWLVTYKKLLRKRNELLKASKPDLKLLKVITSEFINYVKAINSYRNLFCQKVNKALTEISQGLEVEKIALDYSFLEDNLDLKYEAMLDTDLKYKMTCFGPHKDNYRILIDGKDARIFASQGQQRTIMIALKLAIVEILKKKYNDEIVLLLDDVFAELDSRRQSNLVKYLHKNQTFITTTSLIEIPNYLLEKALIINIGWKDLIKWDNIMLKASSY